jgi:hypothetical protein
MKFAFLSGGFLGFSLVTIAGLSAGRSADLVLRDAAIGCLSGALLLRWFWSVVIRSFADALVQRKREAAALEEAHAAARAIPVGPNASTAAAPRSR